MARLAKDFERLAKAKGNTATSAYRQLTGGDFTKIEISSTHQLEFQRKVGMWDNLLTV